VSVTCACLASYAAELPPRCSQPGQRPCPEIVERWQQAQAERIARVNPGLAPRHPYRTGQVVRGRDAAGADFEGKVTSVGAHHVVLDDLCFTPVSLVLGTVEAEGATKPAPQPEASAAPQLDLFGGQP
jgi:hypothetical protein